MEDSKDDKEKDKNNNKKKGIIKTGISKILSPKKEDNDWEEVDKNDSIYKDINKNKEYIKNKYSVPDNSDFVIREFSININKNNTSAFIIFFDGMIDRKIVNDNVLEPLMVFSNLLIKSNENDLLEYVNKHLLPHNQVKISNKFSEIINEVNFGGCGVFIDGCDYAIAADVKGWEHRTVGRPNTEIVIRGPQEGFSEVLRINNALVRKILKDEDVICESIIIGKRNRMPCSMMYIKDITNKSLIGEIRRRLKNIKVDYITDSGELEQLIEDSSILPIPQMLATERPDRVASMLAEGRVAILLHGSPFALVAPSNISSLFNAAEDQYIRFPYSNFLKAIRIIGAFASIFLPAIYLAIINYHHEMIPTDLLLALETARERVPFPSVIEILIMEISFELIREAGIRIPGPIGPTLGIIGALILGQAAVAANVVSPILIIIVAVTGIGSFAVPNYSLAYAFRMLRFIYIALSYFAGFLGISIGVFIQGLWFVNSKSFGVPLLSPFAPKTKGAIASGFTQMPIWKNEKRPDFLNTIDQKNQPEISREWTDNESSDNKKGK